MNYKSMIKHKFKRLLGEYSHLKLDTEIKKKWFGSDYGGFYVANQFLNSSSVIYSFGIGEDVSFDTQLIHEHSCKVYGFDPTPKSIDWVMAQDLPDRFTFKDYGIGAKSKETQFYLPINENHVSGSATPQKNVSQKRAINVQLKSIADIANELGHSKIDVLKMDIEGLEYEIIDTLVKTPLEINQICVEFHDRFFSKPAKSIEAMEKLRANGYLTLGVSESYEEISLIHNRLI